MRPEDMLDRAADLIDRVGHWNGTGPFPHRADHPQCALTAIGREIHLDAELMRVAGDAAQMLENFVGGGVEGWNDRHTHEEVTSAMRACAAVERAKREKATVSTPATPATEPEHTNLHAAVPVSA